MRRWVLRLLRDWPLAREPKGTRRQDHRLSSPQRPVQNARERDTMFVQRRRGSLRHASNKRSRWAMRRARCFAINGSRVWRENLISFPSVTLTRMPGSPAVSAGKLMVTRRPRATCKTSEGTRLRYCMKYERGRGMKDERKRRVGRAIRSVCVPPLCATRAVDKPLMLDAYGKPKTCILIGAQERTRRKGANVLK
jgi:hypothetical protein